MLSIEIDGQYVDYLNSISIQITDTNPLFSDSLFNEPYSYSFDLPPSPRNFAVLAGNESAKLSCTIKHTGLVYIVGVVRSIKESSKGFQVNIVENAIEVRKLAENTDISELDLAEYTICDAEDTAAVKIDKWYTHMRLTISEGMENGTHKFPKIFSDGYNDGLPALNTIHQFNHGIINAYSLSEYLKNTEVPNAFMPESKNWYLTVSPCPRLEYVFNEVCAFLGIKKVMGDIFDIPEFKQLIAFSGYVLDKREIEGTKNYNVHGLGFKLEDFLPEVKMFEIFNLLHELFGAYFVMRGKKLNIYRRDAMIQKKPLDFSKYASGDFFNELASTYTYTHSYTIDDAERKRYYGEQYSDIQNPQPKIQPYATFESGTGEQEVDLPKAHLPMVSGYFTVSGTYITYADYTAGQPEDQYGYEEFSSFFGYRGLIKSDEYPDESVSKASLFHLGLMRGVYDTKKLIIDGSGTIIGSLPIEHSYCSNYNQIQIHPDTAAAFASYMVNFGESSIYYRERDNIFDLRHARFYEFLKDYREVTKSLNIPGHIIDRIRNWKEPHHLIKQRNMSFQGFVKSITFTLTKSSISPAEITYLVKNDSRK